MNSLIEGASQHPALKAIGKEYDQRRRDVFSQRFSVAQKNGEIPTQVNAQALADFFAAQSLALGVMGRTGTNKNELRNFIDVAMTALPANH